MERAKALKVNAGTEADADLGPVISQQVHKLIQAFVEITFTCRKLTAQRVIALNKFLRHFVFAFAVLMWIFVPDRQRSKYADQSKQVLIVVQNLCLMDETLWYILILF